MPRTIRNENVYLTKLLKLIPSEIIATYLFVQGIIPESDYKIELTIVSAILLIATPFYLRKFQNVNTIRQIIISTISFIVWLFTFGHTFQAWISYPEYYGSVVLALWTLLAPLFMKRTN
jgi:hypothetical protein